MLKRQIFFPVLFFIILIPLIMPFLIPGTINTFDGFLHQSRVAAFHASISSGIIPPRWSSSLAYGWGSPVLQFNWSLPYWMAEPFLFLHWQITDAYNAVIILSILLQFFTTYIFYRIWLGVWSGIVAATISVWSLFYLYTVYVSGAIGMQVAFIFWPLIFLSIIYSKRGQYIQSFLLGSTAIAGTMLAHQVMLLMILPMAFVFALVNQFHEKRLPIVRTFLFSICMGLVLCAYFWLPAFMEKHFINIGSTQDMYQANFIPLKALFTQPRLYEIQSDQWWKKVYGSHLYGIGWPILIIIFLSLIPFTTKKPKKISTLFIYIFFFSVSLFLTLPASAILWKTIPLLSTFIYPIRFQLLAIFSAAGAGAIFIYTIKNKAIYSLVFIGITIFLNYSGIPKNMTRMFHTTNEYLRGDTTSDVWGEFLPKWADKDILSGKKSWKRQATVRVINGKITIDQVQKFPNRITFTTSSETYGTIIINQLFFPGWKLTDMFGKQIPLTIHKTGEIETQIPKGKYTWNLIFADTPIRKIGNLITLISTLSMIGIYFFYVIRQKKFIV